MQDIILSNGVEIPRIGLGTYPMIGETLTSAVVTAYKSGYRLIDTADNYYNEADLGLSLQKLYNSTDAKRNNLFIVSKISDELYRPTEVGGGCNKGIYFWKSSPVMQGPNAVHKVVQEKIRESLKRIKTDYLDLYLMHWPYPDFFEDIWYEMELIYKQGLVRAIGVCNCRERHFEKLREHCEIFPMVNQFETSPLNTKDEIIDYCDSNGIRVMVYSPLKSLNRMEFIKFHKLLEQLAEKYSCTKAQIILRFDVQRGLIPIPKSSNRSRLLSNINIDYFTLDESEIMQLKDCNVNLPYMPESRSCPGL